MKKQLDYIKANPAGNITGFVVGPVFPGYRSIYANAIMEQVDSEVEQVGFITTSYDGAPLRMDMMGGEFCGNATRSYGLYAARYMEGDGDMEVEVYVSGLKKPLIVLANKEKSTASVALPEAKKLSEVEIEGSKYTVVELEGIVHTIIDDKEEDREFVDRALDVIKNQFDEAAYGVLFLNPESHEMVPYVYVVGSDTLYREGSCGSGSVAAGYYLNKDEKDDFKVVLKQPSGSIEVVAQKVEGVLRYSIGGKVEFEEQKVITIDVSEEAIQKVKDSLGK